MSKTDYLKKIWGLFENQTIEYLNKAFYELCSNSFHYLMDI